MISCLPNSRSISITLQSRGGAARRRSRRSRRVASGAPALGSLGLGRSGWGRRERVLD